MWLEELLKKASEFSRKIVAALSLCVLAVVTHLALIEKAFESYSMRAWRSVEAAYPEYRQYSDGDLRPFVLANAERARELRPLVRDEIDGFTTRLRRRILQVVHDEEATDFVRSQACWALNHKIKDPEHRWPDDTDLEGHVKDVAFSQLGPSRSPFDMNDLSGLIVGIDSEIDDSVNEAILDSVLVFQCAAHEVAKLNR